MVVGDKVFMYGTLRRGQYNYFRLYIHDRAEFLHEATLQDYGMYSISGYFPGLQKLVGASVTGELFEVTDRSLPTSLDTLEGYPTMYTREQLMTSGGIAWVYIFKGDVSSYKLIKSGNWLLRDKEEAA